MLPPTHLNYFLLGEQKTPKHLCFVFHGYGASAEGIAPLAEAFVKEHPDMLFLVPQAPHPFLWDPSGAMWFEVGDLSSAVLLEGLESILPLVIQEIKALQSFFQVAPENTVVMGFSQGAMISLGLNQEGETLAQTVVAFSGGYPKPLERCDPSVRYLLIHGERDDVVIPERSFQAKEFLESAGADVSFYMLKGLDHSIDARGLALAKEFLNSWLEKES